MKVGWNEAKLGDVCDFKNGLWKGKKEPYIHVGVIRNTNFTKNGSLDPSDIAFLDVESKQYATRKLQFGDIILEKSGGGPKQAVGRVAFFDRAEGEYSFSNFTSVMRVRNPKQIDSTYLHRLLYFYYLSGATESMQKHSTGIRNLQLKEYKDLSIALPPLSEQKRIVAILDEAFEGIDRAVANTEKNLANARELFESYLNNVFTRKGQGWVEKRLGDTVCSVSTGPFGSVLHKSDYIKGGTPVINPINIIDNLIIPIGTKTVSAETTKRLKNYALDAGDIVIGRRGEIGRCSVVQADQAGWLCGTGCFYIKPSNNINPYFLSNLIRCAKYREELENVATGTTMKNLSNTSLKNLEIAFPSSVEDQKSFVSEFDGISAQSQRLESIYQRKLTALAELKQSLLQKAFSGELTTSSSATSTRPFSRTISGISTTDLHAGILAIAYQQHEDNPKQKNTFGRVKAEKISHLVEVHVSINLDRQPIKDAAGPNDFPHLLKVTSRAKKAGFFNFKKIAGDGYSVDRYRRFDEIIEKTQNALGDDIKQVKGLIELMVKMNTQQAEIFSTVYAAWNNLLILNKEISDEAIVVESRENWHEAKMKIGRDKFFKAIKWMRDKKITPVGNGKLVEKKAK
jgi:type I restriction enzyme, S subunit